MCLRVVWRQGHCSALQVIMQILKLVVILAAGPVHHVVGMAGPMFDSYLGLTQQHGRSRSVPIR